MATMKRKPTDQPAGRVSAAKVSRRNRTFSIPTDVLQRVQIKLAKEDRKMNQLVIELFEQWAADEADDGLTPGQRFVRNARKVRAKLRNKEALETDKNSLMDSRE